MQESIEQQVNVPGTSVFIGTSQWSAAEEWVCPPSRYVLCQRLSESHAALLLETAGTGVREVYSRVRSLGFMPSCGSITMHPLGQPLRTLNCWFDRDYFEDATGMDTGRWSDLAGAFLPVVNRTVQTMMQRLHVELIRPGFGSELVIEAASTMIAVEMARLGRGRAAGASPAVGGGLAPWQVRRVRERISAALELGYPSVQELADLCGISRGHLTRMFKITTGQSVQGHIAGQRLEAARRMLTEDSLSIKEVAARAGFSSAGHFTNAFRREEQMTPGQFRQFARARHPRAH